MVVLAHGSIAPSAILFFSLGITKFGSTLSLIPIPSHSSQAPKGLLNENNLGSISSIVKPLSGHANLVEKINFSNFLNFFGNVSSSYSTKTNPLAKFTEVSMLSANLLPKEELKTILSINMDISCLIFLFNSGTFSISYNVLSILIFLKPLFLKLSISFLYSPLRPLTTGAYR